MTITPWPPEAAAKSSQEIELVASPQNALGFLHDKDGVDGDVVGFENERRVRPEFSLFDYGLLGGAEIVAITEETHCGHGA